MDEIITKLDTILTELKDYEHKLDITAKSAHLRKLEEQSQQPDFWQQDDTARRVMQEIADLKDEIDLLQSLTKDATELRDLAQMTLSEADDQSLEQDIQTQFKTLNKRFNKLSTRLFLQKEHDKSNAIVSIHAGQGGTEAMDWAQMLARMYLRYFESQDWKVDLLSQSFGEEAGIKSTTFLVTAPYAYGYLKNESGTHRLVRLSPFNADNLRQTSFALVEVLPELAETHDIKLNDDELEWQFFRSSGKGAQNVNKVSTAVRLKHLPTGIIVESQAERSQAQNRELAKALLKAKLWEKAEREQAEKIQNIKGSYHPASWGTQIRSYVLHPYQLVKDNRTQVEVTDTEAVLDGNIQPFIDAEIQLS